MRRRICALVLAGLLPWTAAPAADTALPRIEDLFADYKYTRVRMSPNGRYLAVLMPIEGRDGLAVLDWSERKVAGAMRFAGNEVVTSYRWVKDNKLLIYNGEVFGWRDLPANYGELFIANADGSDFKPIYGYRVGGQQTGSRIPKASSTYGWGAFVSDLPAEPDHILIASYPWFNSPGTSTPTAYRVDLRTAVLSKVLKAPLTNAAFLATRDGEIRFATGVDQNDNERIYEYLADSSEWQAIAMNSVTGFQFLPLGMTADAGKAYFLSDKGGKHLALYAFDLRTRDESMLYRDEAESVYDIYADPHSGEALWAMVGPERDTVYLQPDHPISQVRRMLDKTFKGQLLEIVDVTRDYKTMLVATSSDVDPGAWYFVDMASRKAEFLIAATDRIDPERMLPVSRVSLAARDGLVLQGYYTRPAGKVDKPPMVLLVHGGPHSRDEREFNPEVQLLASRGYAVLQVNFRGSTGHGREFEVAGRGEWGRKMQDDLTDATRWAIQEGLADPERICIMGGSYGGYAALMGLVREPDLYRCAIAFAAVSDLETMFKEGDVEDMLFGKAYLRSAIGDDKRQWDERSPSRQAAAIRAPVLLVHGGEDQRVPIKHAKLMEKALKNAGRPVETLYIDTEGHGFFKPEHRVRQYQKVLDFLGRHNPVPR